MPPLIIPIFVLHQGCPQRCIYCNEEKAVGADQPRITEAGMRETVAAGLTGRRRKKGPLQIAFYGGNFTGIDRERQRELLELANVFIREGLVESIRISTRPDYIDAEGLDFLKKYNVRTVEIGAQSLADDVLLMSRRGHTAADVSRAMELLQSRGLETGIHLMVGLPGDSSEGFARTVAATIALAPDTVRIHPTLVLAGTELAAMWARGDYQPLSMAEAVIACKQALSKFTAAGIPVIRLGLQTTPALEKPGSIMAGPYHPAFRSLVEEAIFFDMAAQLLDRLKSRGGEATCYLSPGDVASFRGPKNRNLAAIKEKFPQSSLTVAVDPNQPRGCLVVTAAGKTERLTVADLRPAQLPYSSFR
jgi:histone acetyltransferase (RNA polymerase elongator complex component)